MLLDERENSPQDERKQQTEPTKHREEQCVRERNERDGTAQSDTYQGPIETKGVAAERTRIRKMPEPPEQLAEQDREDQYPGRRRYFREEQGAPRNRQRKQERQSPVVVLSGKSSVGQNKGPHGEHASTR